MAEAEVIRLNDGSHRPKVEADDGNGREDVAMMGVDLRVGRTRGFAPSRPRGTGLNRVGFARDYAGTPRMALVQPETVSQRCIEPSD